MKTDIAVRASTVGKCYQIYDQPLDRLKQSLWRGRKQFYREFWALKDASLEIKKGETVGIIGSNGSGKSTLLQLICGILNPTKGEISVNGRVAALLELGAGFNPEFTGRENVYMNAAIMGLSRAEIDARYHDITNFANIGNFINLPVKTYSSGMYLRLAFSVAVNVSPEILLVDEALSVGDARFQQKCMAKIKEFCRAGTVVFVSHDMAAVTELCNRVVWIESGQVRLDGKPKYVTEEYFQFIYGDEALKIDHDLGVKGSKKKDLSKPRESKPLSSRIIPSSKKRIDLNTFPSLDHDLRQFGNRGVTIESVRLRSPEGISGTMNAGNECELSILVHTHEDISHPMAAYMLKDRLGREIFGDRHALSSLPGGKRYVVTFNLKAWPNLVEGVYSLTVGVADGTVEKHVQCHVLYDVLIITSIPVIQPSTGIFSLPDTEISVIEVEN